MINQLKNKSNYYNSFQMSTYFNNFISDYKKKYKLFLKEIQCFIKSIVNNDIITQRLVSLN